jgi:hypothetical protein
MCDEVHEGSSESELTSVLHGMGFFPHTNNHQLPAMNGNHENTHESTAKDGFQICNEPARLYPEVTRSLQIYNRMHEQSALASKRRSASRNVEKTAHTCSKTWGSSSHNTMCVLKPTTILGAALMASAAVCLAGVFSMRNDPSKTRSSTQAQYHTPIHNYPMLKPAADSEKDRMRVFIQNIMSGQGECRQESGGQSGCSILFIGGNHIVYDQHQNGKSNQQAKGDVEIVSIRPSLFIEILAEQMKLSADCRMQRNNNESGVGGTCGGARNADKQKDRQIPSIKRVTVYGQVLDDRHPMLAFLHSMIQSGIQDEPYAWPLHAFVTSLQKACLQIRSEKTRAQKMLRQAQPSILLDLEDVLVPQTMCDEVLPGLQLQVWGVPSAYPLHIIRSCSKHFMWGGAL